MTSNLLIGCGQITWRGVPEEQILAEIAQAGYIGAPAAPKEGQSAADVIAPFTKYGLKPAPGYLGADYWDKSQEATILQRARDYAAFAKAAGCTELYVAAGGFNSYVTKRGLNRSQIAGHVKPADAMTDAEFAQFGKALNAVGEITLAQGVKSCFHNHVGSTIETREEIDRLWRQVDPTLVFMGPDTGHLAWAGADVVQFCRDYARSIKTMHIKDVNQQVMDEGVAAEWDYRTFGQRHLDRTGPGFCRFSSGFPDFKGRRV